jgi:hypothetical protein
MVGAGRAIRSWAHRGFWGVHENAISKVSPEGTAELSPGRSPGSEQKGRPVPQGRLKTGDNSILDNFQPSLRDSIMLHDVPRTGVLG